MAASNTHTIRDLYERLTLDSWRESRPISDDIALVNSILFKPYAYDAERILALTQWLQGNQPCLFGRITAAQGQQHVCLLNHDELRSSDHYIREKIRQALTAWKQRSVEPKAGFSNPAHGFLLLAYSDRLAWARPDQNLYDLCMRLQELWGCLVETHPGVGDIYFETLYLKNPADATYVKFTFSVDFFAIQGDGRWWHDHRIPGGIAFTANSVGHMRRYREWYGAKGDQRDWLLQTAMLTINNAEITPFGRATWLRPLMNGKPVEANLACPFKVEGAGRQELSGKDWTRYDGHLHPDHSVRKEFFRDDPAKGKEFETNQWIADFSYLYDERKMDYLRFTAGEVVSEEEVFSKIGSPQDYVSIVPPRLSRKDRIRGQARSELESADIINLLRQCEKFRLQPDELRRIME